MGQIRPSRGDVISASALIGIAVLTIGIDGLVPDNDAMRTTWTERLRMAPVLVALGLLYLVIINWCMKRASWALVQIAVCPQCHYDLHGLGARDDGCTLCPECGAAWSAPTGMLVMGERVESGDGA